MTATYYRENLARIHHEGYGHHADRCAPGILSLLEPVRLEGGDVLELGCGSGLLTRFLTDAGHRVIATDASPAMLDLTRETAPEADICRLVMPDDPMPPTDAIISIGHAISYLPSADAIGRALLQAAEALRPGGLLAIDICDLAWGERWGTRPPEVRVTDDWVLTTVFSTPSPDRYIRDMTTFVKDDAGRWHRDDERHVQVNVRTDHIPDLLAAVGVDATIGTSFGNEELPVGLVTIIGHKRG